jgi:putative zinc finger/helix-turn-helix YgiT family protein
MWTVIGTIRMEFEIMICIKCENEVFAGKPNAIIEQEFRGETFKVRMTASACTKCGWTTITLGQADELRRLTADAYRKKHNLLTSVQIKSIRRLKGNMSQRDFAKFLDVGEASVKRWETWLVQEKSSDQLIRMKCAEELRVLELTDTSLKCHIAKDWTHMASLHAALISAYTIAVQPTSTAIQPPVKRARPAARFSPDNDPEREHCITSAANEELALAA